jgi:hypothetical protein
MLYINLSFDHELFLGENFVTEKEIVIDTTDRLLSLLEKHKVSGTFFTDVCSIIRYTELGMYEFPELMKDQLKRLVRSGQDVQLHIHSNWLKSDYKDGKWIFDTDSYRVQYFDLENKEKNNNWTMERIIKEGKELLESILKSEWSDYSCIAYRAGGFCIQPEEELISNLIENGIVIDSSVAPGISSPNSNVNSYDFRKTPRNVMNWYISPSGGIEQNTDINEKQKIFEVPIGTAKRNIISWVLTKNKNINTRPLRGSFISYKDAKIEEIHSKKINIINRLRQFSSTPAVLSLDYYDAKVLVNLIKQIYKKYKCDKNDVYISVICHPKLVNDELIDNMERFIKEIQNTKNVSFCNMVDVYEMIKKEGRK